MSALDGIERPPDVLWLAMYPRMCPGCGQHFTTATVQQGQCRKSCGRSNESRNRNRAAASAARRAAYVPTYGAMHQRLRSSRGSARSYLSHGCGAAAVDRAYDHADPDEQIIEKERFGVVGAVVAYSLDLAHYLPVCRSCHATFDEGRGRDRQTTS